MRITWSLETSAHGLRTGARAGGSRGSFGHGVGGANFSLGIGGASFGRGGVGFSRSGGAIRSFSASHGSQSRSFSGNHFVGHHDGFAIPYGLVLSPGQCGARPSSGHRVITNAALHSAHVPFHFQGRFFGSPAGPVF
jgi:hypothetical protein